MKKQTVKATIKRFLTVILAAALVVTGMPLTSLAEETQPEIPSIETEYSLGSPSSVTEKETSSESDNNEDEADFPTADIPGGGIDGENSVSEEAAKESTEEMTEEAGIEKLDVEEKLPRAGEGFVITGTTLTEYSGSGGEITIPDGVVTIAGSAFKDNKTITKVTFSSSVKTIGSSAFQNCQALKTVVLNDGLTKIGESAFSSAAFGEVSKVTGLTTLGTLTIPGTVTEIGQAAFKSCQYLKKAVFENGADQTLTMVSGWEEGTFQGCRNLEEVTLPDRLKILSGFMFKGCSALKTVTLGTELTEIDRYAFDGCSSLSGITLPAKVTKIGEYAFRGAAFGGVSEVTGLTTLGTLTIPGTVIKIEKAAFEDCQYLKKAVFENGSDQILTMDSGWEEGTFQGCKNLEEVVLPDRLKILSGFMFEGCKALKTVTLGTELTEIDRYAFDGCSSLSGITLPAKVTKIGAYAFRGCSSLKAAELNDGLTTIGESAFSGAAFGGVSADTGETTLGTLTIPGTVTEIGQAAFKDCQYLKKAVFGDGPAQILTMISGWEEGTFQGCRNLEEVTLPDRLKILSGFMFKGCSALKTVTLGTELTEIDRYAFDGCSSLSGITLPAKVTKIGEYAFRGAAFGGVSKDTGETILGTLTIPGAVTAIGIEAFKNCQYLKKVVFENGSAQILTMVSGWEEGTFQGCRNLEEVVLPDRLKILSGFMFKGCKALKTVTLGTELTEIDRYAFDGCSSLSGITLPAKVTKIGAYAFRSCSSLKAAELNDGLTTIGENAFSGAAFGGVSADTGETPLGTLTIPGTVIKIGKAAFEDCQYLKKAVFENKTAIKILTMDSGWEEGTFQGCRNLEEVTLPDRLKILSGFMFKGCSALKTVTLGTELTEIDRYAFDGCSSLSGITLPAKVTAVGEYAFRNCSSLKAAELNNGLKTIDTCAFKGAAFGNKAEPGTLKIPGTVLTIGSGAFADSAYLNKVVFADGIVQNLTINSGWDEGVFQRCPRLATVILPESLKSLEKYTFCNDPELNLLYIPNKDTEIKEGAIQKSQKLTIYGIAGSKAEAYAKKNGIKFSAKNISTKNTLNVKIDSASASQDVSLAVSADGIVFTKGEFNKDTPFDRDANVKIKLTLTQPDKYVIESVKIGSKALSIQSTDKTEAEFVYAVPFNDFSANVTVKLKKRPARVKIMMTGTSDLEKPVVAEIKDKIALGTEQPIEGGFSWYCDIENNPANLTFTIKATNVSSRPIVKYGASSALSPTPVTPAVKNIAKPQATVYTYTIPADGLADKDVITITQESSVKCKIILEDANQWAKVIPTISQDGKVYDPKTETETEAKIAGNDIIYEVLRGSELTVRADQRKNVTLTSLSYPDGTRTKTVKARNGMAEIIFSDVREDITVKVNVTGGYEQSMKETDAADKEVKAVKNIYNVSYNGKYTAGAKKSWKNDETVTVTKAELFVDKAKTAECTWKTTDQPDAANVFNQAADGKSVNVDIGKLSAGDRTKKLTLKLYDGDAIAATYILQVYKPITRVNIKSASVQQMADTQKAYALTTDGEIAKLKEEFTVTVEDTPAASGAASTEKVVTAALINEKGELLITTGNKLGKATITLKQREGSAEKTITVQTTRMLEKAKLAPAVTCVADDISLNLTLALKNIPEPVVGEIFYEITAKARVDAKNPESKPSKLKEEEKVYIKRTDDLQRYRLIMQKLAENAQPQKGQGEKWNYDVTVRLVYSGSKIAADGLNADGSTKNEITVVKYSGTTDEIAGKPVTKTFSTLAPAYEAKLQLTKGTTTVYTGQTNILVATAKFDKNTTYTSIDKIEADTDLQAVLDKDTGRIAISPKEGMMPGKYAIVATAEAFTGMVPSTAKIDITIVKGIKALKVDVPAESLYKAPKKTVAIRPTVIYNENDVAPKTKKVEWSITDAQGQPFAADSYLGRMLSINKSNGTVTVNKDFVLSKDDAKNQFTITASARDFKNFDEKGDKTDNPVKNTSQVITITNKITDITAIGLVREKTGENQEKTDESQEYEIIALNTDSGTLNPKASQIHGAKLVAFKEAVDKNTLIASADALSKMIIPAENLSFVSNKKDKIAVDENGNIQVITPCTVKLTATATDGSGKKKDMALNVAYDPAENLKLTAAQFTGVYTNGERQYGSSSAFAVKGGSYSYEYKGTTTLFKLTVTGNDDKPLPGFANYEIKAGSGTKLLYKEGSDVYIAATAKDAKVTFQNKGSADVSERRKVYTYVLTNSDWGSKAALGVTQDTSKKLYAYGQEAELSAKLLPNARNLKNLLDNTTGLNEGNLRAYVEIDWSKRTDKNEAALRAIAEKITLGALQVQSDEKAVKYINLKAKANIGKDAPLIPGRYDLKVTFGKCGSDGSFTGLTPPTAVKITIDAAKAVTFIPNSSYTINLKNKETDVQITKNKKSTNAMEGELGTITYALLNANTGGKSNEFKKYFEILGDKICLKENVDATKIDKKDLTGYLSYEVDTKMGYCSNSTIKGVMKVTISFRK